MKKIIADIKLAQLLFEQIEVYRRLYFETSNLDEKIYLLVKIRGLVGDLQADIERNMDHMKAKK